MEGGGRATGLGWVGCDFSGRETFFGTYQFFFFYFLPENIKCTIGYPHKYRIRFKKSMKSTHVNETKYSIEIDPTFVGGEKHCNNIKIQE